MHIVKLINYIIYRVRHLTHGFDSMPLFLDLQSDESVWPASESVQ